MNKIKDLSAEEEYYSETTPENEQKKNLPFVMKSLLFCIGGMGFACFNGFDNISPFSVSFLSAVPFQYCLPSFIGSTVGYFVTADEGSLLRYIGASLLICLFRIIMNRRFKERESSYIGSVITFCSLFFSGIIYLWFEDLSLLPILLLISESIIGLFSSLMFILPVIVSPDFFT